MTSREFNVEAYLGRIGLPGVGSPSLATLQMVIDRHSATIPFENLDIVLGRPIRLDIEAIQAKLVAGKRGGYCFEQNTLLRAALEALGFTVRSLMARVVRSAPADAITPRTHMLLRVELPEGAYLADVGFGNLTPTAPLLLTTAASQTTKHEDYRLRPSNRETLMQAHLGTQWENVYRFSDEESHPIDHEVGNWFTSTKPHELFTANVIAARPGANCRTTLFNGLVTIRDADNQTEHVVLESANDLREALRNHFGIDLDGRELATVYSAVRRCADRAEPGLGLD